MADKDVKNQLLLKKGKEAEKSLEPLAHQLIKTSMREIAEGKLNCWIVSEPKVDEKMIAKHYWILGFAECEEGLVYGRTTVYEGDYGQAITLLRDKLLNLEEVDAVSEEKISSLAGLGFFTVAALVVAYTAKNEEVVLVYAHPLIKECAQASTLLRENARSFFQSKKIPAPE